MTKAYICIAGSAIFYVISIVFYCIARRYKTFGFLFHVILTLSACNIIAVTSVEASLLVEIVDPKVRGTAIGIFISLSWLVSYLIYHCLDKLMDATSLTPEDPFGHYFMISAVIISILYALTIFAAYKTGVRYSWNRLH